MQIKLVILTICASLAAIGLAAPPPSVGKPAGASKGAVGSDPFGSLSGTLGGVTGGKKKGGLLGGTLIPGIL
ncbi:hypothetical protein BCV72DRAFT_228715 [Rhizopus microsporus var. microsporus]|uniref:Uncharacterized protein n=2 Tax=Rhizopus microsporus TaxID=58291 RepID=A0A2G4T3D7_RHIZD|nr:uncharacterized protein RHIMIDRAFT_272733 [Rhizopus microsporus ATCC 52813]ORE06152.1 hypothetical protein BCV72DRAFT_228715 [Rhizopus microsporus var. microsporus]PHZ15519.1 hypothetical protein RHIMIDRAFT_272733 [Rhizopus microsporus ATCC 52813]